MNKITLWLSEANNGGRLSFRYIIYTFCLLLAEYMFLQGTSILIRNRLLKNKIIMIESVVDLRKQNRKAIIRMYWPICYREFGRKNIEGVARCVSVIHLSALTKYLLGFFFFSCSKDVSCLWKWVQFGLPQVKIKNKNVSNI